MASARGLLALNNRNVSKKCSEMDSRGASWLVLKTKKIGSGLPTVPKLVLYTLVLHIASVSIQLLELIV